MNLTHSDQLSLSQLDEFQVFHQDFLFNPFAFYSLLEKYQHPVTAFGKDERTLCKAGVKTLLKAICFPYIKPLVVVGKSITNARLKHVFSI